MKKPVKTAENRYPSEDLPLPLECPARALLKRAVIAQMRAQLSLAGVDETGGVLLADVERHASYLERCAKEAEAVLQGDLAAATRLWLLLREPIGPSATLSSALLSHVAGAAWHGAPLALDGEALLRLVAGVVRAANQPAESEAMLDGLALVLQPFFHLEVAAAAVERARQGYGEALETFVTARGARQWRAALLPPVEPTLTRVPCAVARPVFDRDRVPYDLESWRDHHLKDRIDPWDSGWPCMGGTRKAMSQIDRFGPRYTIDSLAPSDACPGHTLIIRGRNFGRAGRVYFPSPGIKDPAFSLGAGDPAVLIGVTPKRWTEGEVEVVVPAWATAGELHLNAFTRHQDLCTSIDVYRLGNSILFQGGLASVYQVSLGGVAINLTSAQPRNLAPGDSVALSWRSSGGPTTRLRIQLMDGATELWVRHGLAAGFGAVVLTVPDADPKVPRTAMLVFTATSACGATEPLRVPVWLSVLPRLSIPYVEVTQGVQGDLGDILAGRGMPTVAYKDTAVRVHLHCDRGGWFSNKLDKITGSLTVDGRRLAPTNVRVLIPDRGFAGVRGLSDPNLTNDTLNFTIPAAWLTPGIHKLIVQVVCNDPSGKIVVFQSLNWTWVAHAPIRVRGLYMALYGSDGFMLDYLSRVLDYLPTPLTGLGVASPRWYTHTYDLSSDDGWSDLLDDVEDAWDDADETSGVRWLGIIPASERFPGMTLAQQGLSGTPGIAALAMGDRPDVGAHELGHTLGLHHINLPIDGPKGPYDNADSGGFLRRPPFDVRSSTAIPLPAGDLMTYFEPIRPGISTWMRVFLNT